MMNLISSSYRSVFPLLSLWKLKYKDLIKKIEIKIKKKEISNGVIYKKYQNTQNVRQNNEKVCVKKCRFYFINS